MPPTNHLSHLDKVLIGRSHAVHDPQVCPPAKGHNNIQGEQLAMKPYCNPKWARLAKGVRDLGGRTCAYNPPHGFPYAPGSVALSRPIRIL